MQNRIVQILKGHGLCMAALGKIMSGKLKMIFIDIIPMMKLFSWKGSGKSWQDISKQDQINAIRLPGAARAPLHRGAILLAAMHLLVIRQNLRMRRD